MNRGSCLSDTLLIKDTVYVLLKLIFLSPQKPNPIRNPSEKLELAGIRIPTGAIRIPTGIIYVFFKIPTDFSDSERQEIDKQEIFQKNRSTGLCRNV